MAPKKQKTARYVAMTALNRFSRRPGYACPVPAEVFEHTAEKQRTTDIVFGTIRNTTAIDFVITRIAGCPVERIPPKLLNIIRIAAYELIYTPDVPEYAIVNEAVENSKIIARKKQADFVNALLRKLTTAIENRKIPLDDADFRKTLPQTTSTGCRFHNCFLPQPDTEQADYLALAFSLPKWLVAGWLNDFGAQKTRQICFASNRRPAIYIRPNKLKTTTHKLTEEFSGSGLDVEVIDPASMIRIKSAGSVTELPGFAQGLFTVQDITASYPVHALKPQPGQTILDLCAAPGVKTAQLAEITGDRATIIATDIDSKRLQLVRENVGRLGIKSVCIVTYENLRQKTAELGLFDGILLDVPCSNTGVLAKRPQVRHRITPQAINECARVQARLLEKAAPLVKSKGRICYSTCSIQKKENNHLIDQFLHSKPHFTLEFEELTLPSAQGFDWDGGYFAALVRR